ncbi:TIM-barrel domain-containing protein [Telmatobacter bradus]|uniref:glycoside hydrolase family 31 protein n=1 Tax=Telmatobacter bradus TaxID=474953 RepID=UPI003B42B59D
MRLSSLFSVLAAGLLLSPLATVAQTDAPKLQIDRNGETIVVEPYAPNIVRVTLSLQRKAAQAAPGYGILAHPDATGWKREKIQFADRFFSSQLTAEVERDHDDGGIALPQQADIGKYFGGSTPGAHITLRNADGKELLQLSGWQQSLPNQKDGNIELTWNHRIGEAQDYVVGASFATPSDEHMYGLGQNQEGFLDLRGHVVHCWHDYNAPGGQSSCVPFLISSKGYGLLWDNESKTTVEVGFNESTNWSSQAGDRVSFFVIAGKTPDEIYEGYRLLTGPTHLLPKSTYGFVQCKQRYMTQQEVLDVAKGFSDRHLPAGVLVVDWFYYTKMGQFDFNAKQWPDPSAMNAALHKQGFDTMISVWPRFTADSRYYDKLLKNGWFIEDRDGKPIDGLPYDKAGSDIDTTNPQAAAWYWETLKDNILSKGFDSLWADETEPDLPPNGAYFHIGSGTRYFNVYPLLHTGAIFDGFRRDFPERRALILSRDAFTGAQRNGTVFWSSDIAPTWDTFRRQIPTGLNFSATGFAYWSNDTGGWQNLPAVHKPEHTPLLDPSDARAVVGGYDDYPELFTRWFEYSAFTPVFRTHGSRLQNEIWSYGKQAEPILTKYLRLRYQLLPYIYSLGYQNWKTGAPFMRALPLDFGNDLKTADIRDEYMFGPALLVAPVTEQGATSRSVYLPAGTDWYNYWTNERVHGGQTLQVDAPIDTIPLFVRAGSILPLGGEVASAKEQQPIAQIRVYPGADTAFTLFADDGSSYAYEHGGGNLTELRWNDATQKFTHSGAEAWSGTESSVLQVVGH